MDAVFDFLRAALPWIAVGLLLAVLVARGTSKNKKEEQTGDYVDYSQVSGHAFSKNLSRSSCLCLLPV